MCIAILNDSLVRISVKFRPQVPNGGNVNSSVPSGVDGIRTAVDEGRQKDDADGRSSVEKQCTLIPLAAMSSARCGLGTAILNGHLVAVGTLLQSLLYSAAFAVLHQ